MRHVWANFDSMNPFVAKTLFHIGTSLRNPSLPEEYRRLKESEFIPLSQLQEIQLNRLKALVSHAQRSSPFYRARFRELDLNAEDLRSIEDLQRVPVIDKATLIANNATIHTSGLGRHFVAETSGTSGVALEFKKSERWDSINRAHLMRAYSWYGVQPWDRNGYLWGYNIAPRDHRKVKLLDALQNRFRLFRYQEAEVTAFARRLTRARFVGGYSSMIYETAKIINRLGLRVEGLALVKGTSEMILDVYQQEAQAAFGRKITSEYGAAEAGLIAFECPLGSMHVNIEDVILEVDDEGAAIVTNLASDSFPIIRYRLGDSVAIGSTVCDCGRSHPVIKEIAGRRGHSVIGWTSRYPALTFYYVFKNLAITKGILLNYKATQHEVGRCTLTIEGSEDTNVEKAVREEMRKYFSDDLDYTICYVDRFPTGMKKAQYFESLVNEGR